MHRNFAYAAVGLERIARCDERVRHRYDEITIVVEPKQVGSRDDAPRVGQKPVGGVPNLDPVIRRRCDPVTHRIKGRSAAPAPGRSRADGSSAHVSNRDHRFILKNWITVGFTDERIRSRHGN